MQDSNTGLLCCVYHSFVSNPTARVGLSQKLISNVARLKRLKKSKKVAFERSRDLIAGVPHQRLMSEKEREREKEWTPLLIRTFTSPEWAEKPFKTCLGPLLYPPRYRSLML